MYYYRVKTSRKIACGTRYAWEQGVVSGSDPCHAMDIVEEMFADKDTSILRAIISDKDGEVVLQTVDQAPGTDTCEVQHTIFPQEFGTRWECPTFSTLKLEDT